VEKVSKASGNPEKIRLLIDLPESYPLSSNPTRDYSSYSETMKYLLVNSKKVVRIGIPFIDWYGIDFLVSCLSANQNHPLAQLIIRTYPEDHMDRLWQSNVVVYVMNEEDGHWGFHAKYAIFDDECAIIGSQNLTKRNMSRSLEIGAMLNKEKIRPLILIHKHLIEVSKKIEPLNFQASGRMI